MKTIIQIFTGGWHNANYTPEEIVDRLARITSLIPVSQVIIGWNLSPEIYHRVRSFLNLKNIRMLLWLPVFSEVGELYPHDEALDIFQKPIGNFALQEGENFAFYCPSSAKNMQNVYDLYDRVFAPCEFDGIFLDKIRTQSFAAGVNGVLSCGCERCRKIYEDRGLSLKALQEEYLVSDDDRLYWWDGSDEVIISEQMDQWLHELSDRHEKLMEEDERAEGRSFRMGQKEFFTLLVDIDEYYGRIMPFTDMFYEFIQNLNQKPFAAAAALLKQLSEEHKEEGAVIQLAGVDWEMTSRKITFNPGRIRMKRFMSIMANRKLRQQYFGF